jgi:hypothetical protein
MHRVHIFICSLLIELVGCLDSSIVLCPRGVTVSRAAYFQVITGKQDAPPVYRKGLFVLIESGLRSLVASSGSSISYTPFNEAYVVINYLSRLRALVAQVVLVFVFCFGTS